MSEPGKPRTGLYLMVVLIMLQVLLNGSSLDHISESVKRCTH